MIRNDLRNIAIIAHVDYGKTTLVDALLKQSNTFRDADAQGTTIMDSNELERERGITIFAKNAAIMWKGKKVNILGREYCVGGLTEYDSNGEKFFEFALERDGGRDKSSWRWVLFSGEGCTLWAFWEDRGFWAEFNIPSLPIPSPVPMPFIEEGLKEKETLSFSIPSKGGKKLDVDLQDVRRGSKTTNLFGGSPLMPAPYERESKGVTGSVKGASVRVRDEQRDLMISLYEYGDNEILDDIYVGIPLNPTEDLVFGSLN